MGGDRDSAGDLDATDAERRTVGEGLFDDDPGTLAHLYRGEIHRMRFWRERLDQTAYWAIVVISALLTWTFSSRNNPHYVLLLGLASLAAFLLIEARRFRGYDIWRGRVRTLQKNVFAPGLDPSIGLDDPAWRRKLSEDYHHPAVKITTEEAIAHRLRRVYLFLFTIVVSAWAVRVLAFASTPWPASAAVGRIPGAPVTALVGALYVALVVVAFRPRTWHVHEELDERDLRKRDRG